MIEIKIKQREDFNVIRETLTRIGIANNKEKKLYQSCHILQKQGKYYIIHFKGLLRLDGRVVDYSEEDRNRTADIAALLEDWGLITITEPDFEALKQNYFRVISYRDKPEWSLIHKYKIGK